MIFEELTCSNINLLCLSLFFFIDNDHNHKISKIKVISDQNVQSSADVTKLIPPDTLNKIIESKKQAKPVPAPRISLESQPRVTISEDVTPRKPVIPEKPTTLPRPFSCTFKSIKISDSSDIKSDVSYGDHYNVYNYRNLFQLKMPDAS